MSLLTVVTVCTKERTKGQCTYDELNIGLVDNEVFIYFCRIKYPSLVERSGRSAD